jgi:hypothetical protein
MLRKYAALSRCVRLVAMTSCVVACGGDEPEDGAGGSAGHAGAAGEHAAGRGGTSAGGVAGLGGMGAAGMKNAGSGGMSGGTAGAAAGSGGHAGAMAGSGGMPGPITASAAALKTFPTGLAVGSPAQVKLAGAKAELVPSVRPGVWRYLSDYGRAVWDAFSQRDAGTLARLAGQLLPVSTAQAASADQLELKALANSVASVLAGDPMLPLDSVLDLNRLFAGGGNANCYGPSIDYAHHENASSPAMESGMLPGGDLGMWLEYEMSTQPCVAAQLSRRIDRVKGQAMQGLLLMAAMRHSVETTSGLAMPVAGASTDLATAFEAKLHESPKFVQTKLRAATIALDAGGKTYTYRLVFDAGTTGADAKFAEVIMNHVPGASESEYAGVMQVAAFSLSGDAARGCSDTKDSATNMFQVAAVSSVRYTRNADKLSFSSRAGSYCGQPSSVSSTAYASDVATFTSTGDLDATVKLTSSMRGTTKGWIGDFSRFAGDYDLDTVEGDFLYAWQAGPMDGSARSLALDIQYNTATELRTLQGFFAFAGDISASDGSLLGMICNWAGPGNNHTPQLMFQSQTATMTAGATEFTLAAGSSKLSYAPTNTCSSTTTEFDRNLNHTLEAGEGAGTMSELDKPSGALTVQQEIESRGFAIPTLY